MTATPKRDDNIDTYSYFGDPIYTYTLSQGIEDGFLAPYRMHRIVTSYDVAGKVVPISNYGNVREIASMFGGVEQLREAVQQLQALLYAA